MRPRHLLALVLAFAGSARAAGSLNVVTAVEVKDEGTAVVLHVTGSRPPNFTTFSMADPPRFVIDLSEARLQGVPEDLVVRDGVVNLVKNLSYGSDATSIARIMVAFQLDVDPPDVQAAGNTLVVRIAKPAAAAAAVATDDGAKAREAERKAQETARVAAEAKAQEETARVAAEAKAQEEAARAAAEAKAQEETARAAAEAKAQEETARAAAEAKAQEEAARAAAKAKAQEEAARAAEAQARADVEKAEALKEAAAAEEKSRGDAQSAEEARAAYEKERQAAVARAEEEAQARARAEADAREAEAQARADAERKSKDAAAEARASAERELAATNATTAVLHEAPSRAPAAAEPAEPEATPAIADAPAVAHASADALDIGAPRAQLREVGFRQLPGASRVYVRTSVTPRFTIQDVGENVIRVELENTRATRRNDLRHLDTSFFPSAVAVVTPARRGASYVLDIKLRERVPYQQRIEGDMLAIDFERPAAPGTLPVAGPAGTMPAESGAERVPAALEGEAEAAPAAN
ncbi:MAG TPA: AMIN domain-containing protein [Anaeromyxobacter sp.]|nr:AMIN domain-containing protein [Anaeromyxobacter sp.]